MTAINSFKAFHYNSDKVNLNDVVTQPYDKIPSSEWEKYSKKSPYSIVNLILNKILPDDTDTNNPKNRLFRSINI